MPTWSPIPVLLVLKEATKGQITHAAVYRQVNRAYKNKKTVNIKLQRFCVTFVKR